MIELAILIVTIGAGYIGIVLGLTVLGFIYHGIKGNLLGIMLVLTVLLWVILRT